MATDVTSASSTGLATYPNMATGAFTSDGNATELLLGFTPRYVKVVDVTDNIAWTFMEGMPLNAPGTTLKEASAGQTVDTTSAILVGLDPGLQETAANALLSAALCGTGKLIVWMAMG